MPAEVIDRPDPPPLKSHLPDWVQDLAAQIASEKLHQDVKSALREFRQAACYIAAAMIFLRKNVLLESKLSLDDVKPRLLGHWGTCPGIILVWSHLNLLLRKHKDLSMIFVIGPGHGAPAALATLWLEGSLEKFYPGEYDRTADGLRNLITRFSVPGGFPSHINAETPGSIHEGGELGYALGVSFGAAFDKPDIIVPCIIGDGEAETGPTAAAWHAIKYLDPAESGAILPILHVNGFKISERTIFGCMDNKEIVCLFSGYGYQVRIVQDLESIDDDLAGSLEWAVAEIQKIQKAAREGEPINKPRWPMIVLRTPKGWSGPKEVDGVIVEGSFHSHQVPLTRANTDESQLKQLGDWLASYKPAEVLPNGVPSDAVLSVIAEDDSRKLGQIKASYDSHEPLELVEWKKFAAEKGSEASCMQATGKFLDAVFQRNPKSIRMFSPDELESNKLNAILEHTQRNFQWDEYSRAQGGRVIEVLSEHTCQAFLQGYTLTGRTGVFPSYESFLGIVHTMMVQYSKFIKIAKDIKWRGDVSSINYIETSTWTRQEHNGFSHQNPSFIGAILNLKAEAARVYLPPDANCFLSTIHHCLKSKNYVNLMIGSKQPTAVFLSIEEANEHCRLGASIWHFASTGHDSESSSSVADPDVVLVGIGVEVNFESIKAAELLRQICPALQIRFVNVADLMVLAVENKHSHALSRQRFLELFTEYKPVLFNYHGYATELEGLLFGRPNLQRMSVSGYREEGTTTTPFDMMFANGVSRFDVAKKALQAAADRNEDVRNRLGELLKKVDDRASQVKDYIAEHGKDPDHIYRMPQF